MLLVLLAILLVVFVGGLVCFRLKDSAELPVAIAVISGFLGAIVLFCIVVGTINLSQERVIDRKIEMYIEENTSIELSVTTTVEKYLEHEFQIFDSLQGEDIQTLLVVYPEINSNELVKKQIEIFVDNNNKIKELKEDKLNIEVWKWWVYFG